MDEVGEVRHAWIQWREEIDPGFEDPQCRATTILATGGTLILAFFGGPHGGTADPGIWRTNRGSSAIPPWCAMTEGACTSRTRPA